MPLFSACADSLKIVSIHPKCVYNCCLCSFSPLEKIFLRSVLSIISSTTEYLCDDTCQNTYDSDLHVLHGSAVFAFQLIFLLFLFAVVIFPKTQHKSTLQNSLQSRKDRADLYSAGPYASWRKRYCWEGFLQDLVLSEACQRRRTQMPDLFLFFRFCSQRKRF